MRQPSPSDDWPESWKLSYRHDLQEIFGAIDARGYAYAYAQRRRHTLELVGRAARPPARVLDIAAAQGNFSLALAEAGYEVTWNDLRADLIDYVSLKHDRGDLHFAPGNAFDLGLDGRFDVVLITEIIEHVAHPDQFLQKVGRLLHPGGHVVMTTPNGGYFRNRLPKFSECPDASRFEAVQFKPDSDGHIFLLHLDELPSLAAAAGLEILETRLFTNSLTNGHLKTERLLRLLPRPLVEGLDRATTHLPLPLSRKLHTGMAVLLRRPATAAPSRT
jgi:2-polyprenyl-6-hydroxyphenyl methylase/3-demethylubiquinone-9 3-methyltransferase